MAIKAPEVWSEIDARFDKDDRGQLRKAVNLEAVYSSIDNILRTRKGERVYLPEFGGTLDGVLFDPIDSHIANHAAEEVKRVIEIWDDRVFVNSVNFSSEPDSNQVIMTLQFQLRGYPNIFQYVTGI